ncbi:MAG: thioredoxin family protein [Candidatus Absconditabacteria bacterium]
MEIKILGTGCPNCKKLENNVMLAVQNLGIQPTIIKVTDIGDIMSYDIMATPGLVIDEKVVSYGKLLSVDECIEIIKSNNQNLSK